jgi:hypothetical protein
MKPASAEQTANFLVGTPKQMELVQHMQQAAVLVWILKSRCPINYLHSGN